MKKRKKKIFKFIPDTDWDGNNISSVVILAPINPANIEIAEKIDKQVEAYGFIKIKETNSLREISTHRELLVGTEYWVLNLLSKLYIKIDRQELNFIDGEKTFIGLAQLDDLMLNRSQIITGSVYNI